jgi:hypothetical protein
MSTVSMRQLAILTNFTCRPARQHALLALSVAMAISACSASSSPDPTAIKGKFDIGSRSLYLECSGSGNPTVVMDAGLGNTHATWQAVVGREQGVANVHLRPGEPWLQRRGAETTNKR